VAALSEPAKRKGPWWCLRASAVGIVVWLIAAVAAAPASADTSSDPLHGGSGEGLTVIGHSDLGGAGLNGEVAILGDHAYVGMGTNGGFGAQWNRTPKCGAPPSKVKVVNLADAANPKVVSTIDVTGPGEDPGATIARAVSVIKVKPLAATNAFTGDLLAVALESCGGAGRLGVDLYDVSNPSQPMRVGTDTPVIGTATRDVTLVQRPDGRVLALEANQSGGIRVVDVTLPTAPVPVGTASSAGAQSAGAQGCRPFSFAQGVTANAAGSRAYAAFGDGGLLTLDVSNPRPGAPPPTLARTVLGASEEGNSFRFVPNADETAALATDDDLLPSKTTLTVTTGPAAAVTEPGGSAPGVFRACEAIWGNPLYRQAAPTLARQVVFVANGGCVTDYGGLDVTGKIVLLDRTGSGDCFTFDGKARIAQQRGAVAVLVANTRADQAVFSPDSGDPGDAGVTIPLALIGKEAGDAIKAGLTANNGMTATLADNPDTWGALRIFNLPSPSASPTQASVFNAPHTRVLTPGNGLYHAVNPLWDDTRALVAWMSDGLRVVDLADRSAPKAGPFYVPPGVADPTGNYPAVPLVVDVAKFGKRIVISDINGGLYVLDSEAPATPTPTPTSVAMATPTATPTSTPVNPGGCVVSDGFRSVGVKPRRRGANLNFARSSGVTNPVEIKVYKQSRGRKVVPEQVVARFSGRRQSVRWNGRANRPRRKVTNGFYFVRFRVKTADGTDTRRVTLRRSKGRFKVVEPFHRRASCGLLRQFKLGRSVFGGTSRGSLKISYLLSEKADVSVVVLRAGRTVKSFGSESAGPGRFKRLRLPATRLARGSYAVRLTARTAQATVTATLTSRRL